MQARSVQLKDVIYNAANQSFEALVCVHEGGKHRKYACAINAPINMSFPAAAEGLTKQALRLHKAKRGVYSEMNCSGPARKPTRSSFDPRHWLESLIHIPARRAA